MLKPVGVGGRRVEDGGRRRRMEEPRRQEKRGEYGREESRGSEGYTHKNLGCIGNLDAAVSDISFWVPHKAQMGELRESLCDNLYEIWSDIGDGDGEALDSAWGSRGRRGEGDDISGCVLQLHLGIFFWL